ncbi:ABC transporter ATP-binding protein [Flavobacterium fluvii]|nr:ABC transporter ATP-binding protein [Flavobacterium fluvii]
MKDIILKAENISKQYRLGQVGTGTLSHDLNRWWHEIRGKENPYLKIGDTNDRSTKGESDYVWALRDINFEVERGEVLGIIGKNGAGKSTLLKILSKVTAPTTGSIKSRGRIASLLEVGTGFNGEMTGRENIFLNGAILGMTKKEIASKIDEIIDFSGCERYIDTPVKRYSSGMTVRLAFAVAAFLEPEILVIDEVLAVGDAEFQKKAIGKMQDISRSGGRTVLFVSHNMVAVRQLCSRCIVLRDGNLVEFGNTSEMIDNYLSLDNVITVYKSWNNENFPQNNFMIVKDISVHYQDGYVPENGNFIITEKIGITINYEIIEEGYTFIYGANFYNSEEINIFNSHDVTSKDRNEKRKKGLYKATMWVPGNLFSEGLVSISIAFFKPNPYELFIYLEKIIFINIVDEMKGDSARGHYANDFPGFVRPLLNWETNKIK